MVIHGHIYIYMTIDAHILVNNFYFEIQIGFHCLTFNDCLVEPHPLKIALRLYEPF